MNGMTVLVSLSRETTLGGRTGCKYPIWVREERWIVLEDGKPRLWVKGDWRPTEVRDERLVNVYAEKQRVQCVGEQQRGHLWCKAIGQIVHRRCKRHTRDFIHHLSL